MVAACSADLSTGGVPGSSDDASAAPDANDRGDAGVHSSDAGTHDSGDGGDSATADAAYATDGYVPSDAASSGEGSTPSVGCSPGTSSYTERFTTFDTSVWTCEYSCPSVAAGVATFALLPGVAPNNNGSWSKARFLPRRFTCGRFAAKFALSKRPPEAVWWGVALWNDGPNPDQSQFNEINFGLTTSESPGNTQMRFESTKLGNGVSLVVDTGVDLYDGSYHVGELAYDATRVELYFDGRLLQSITDTTVIPTDPMDFLLGTRLVNAPALTLEFDEVVSEAHIEW
jgi:hypothetical protein